MAVLPPGVNEYFPDDREKLTPLFRQYLEIKDQHPQGILFYRLGDFYEMFGPDAVRAARILGLTLTSRSCFKDYKVAMCGVPHHSSAKYIRQLIRAGEIIAVCEQIEDPADAKGLVKRDIARVITAGTLVEDEYLDADNSNYLAVFALQGSRIGSALLESSSGIVNLYETESESASQLVGSVLNHRPSEVLVPGEDHSGSSITFDIDHPADHFSRRSYDRLPANEDIRFFLMRYFSIETLESFGIDSSPAARAALFALIRYLKENYRSGDVALYPKLRPLDGLMRISARTAEHLGIVAPSDGDRHSLYQILNRCLTSCGRRELKRWLLEPLALAPAISARHDAVQSLVADEKLDSRIAEQLQLIPDLERITNRAGLRRTNPKEIRSLADSLAPLTSLGTTLTESRDPLMAGLGNEIGDFTPLAASINDILAADPPFKPTDGGIVRPGADREVDELRELVSGGEQWIADYEEQQREKTGIRTLKVKRTDAFGYFIEVSKANLALVPDDYRRRQTLVNSERFTTPELAEREAKQTHAAALLQQREKMLFDNLLKWLDDWLERLVDAAHAAACSDCLLAFARIARQRNWIRPVVNSADNAELLIEGGRHPIVEEAVGTRHYIPNDCYLDPEHQQIAVVTGPNMGGKSTYLRMVALISILSQAGSFVPAGSARLPVLDQVFTRIGAQDRLGAGQSTFMVEMVETAEILRNCGDSSLVLLDEVGRGTSTYDGISIAKAVVEYLHEHPGRPLTLFATHFFELTDLASIQSRVFNLQVEVARDKGEFVFLYRVTPGAASDSFGIDVASLAGLPESVVTRARQVLAELETIRAKALSEARRVIQTGLFAEDQNG